MNEGTNDRQQCDIAMRDNDLRIADSNQRLNSMQGNRSSRNKRLNRIRSFFLGGDRGAAESNRARRWFEHSIDSWESEARISDVQAERLHRQLDAPQFLVVLPHFGVHLAIGAMFRFPVGSILRFLYVVVNMMLATSQLVLRRIDRHRWRSLMGVHSPLVALFAAFPGVGTFSYLASKPMRSNLFLMRVVLDAVLLKLPGNVYQRSGLRWILAAPRRKADAVRNRSQSMRVAVWAQSIVLIQGIIISGLLAADLLSKIVNELHILDPEMFIWKQIARMLDLGAETSFATWYQVMALTSLAILLVSIALAKRASGEAFHRHWLILGLLALGFSIDEQVKIHDAGGGTAAIRDELGMSGPFYFGWVIVGMLSVVIVVLLFRRFYLALPRVTKILFGIAAVLYVGGEIVLESISGWYVDLNDGDPDFVYSMITSAEEFLGMAGIFFAIAGVLQYVQQRYGELTLSLVGNSAGQFAHVSMAPARNLKPNQDEYESRDADPEVPATAEDDRPLSNAGSTRQTDPSNAMEVRDNGRA